MFRNQLSLAVLVIVDGLRRYALIGLVVLSLVLQVGGLLFLDFIPRDVGRVSADFILSVGWFTGLLFLLFHAVQVMAWDEERRTIHTLLARPISRSQYVIGIYIGLVGLLALLNAVLGALGYCILLIIKDSVSSVYFTHLSLVNYIIAWLGLTLIELVVLAVIMLFSGLVRGGFLVLILTVAYSFICNGLPVVREAFLSRSDESDSLVNYLLTFLTAIFPDFNQIDRKQLITVKADVVLAPELGLNAILLCCYLIIVVWLACLVYERRDLQ